MSTAGIKTPTYLVDENKSGQIKEDYVLVFRFTQAFQNLSSFLKSTIDDCVFKHEKKTHFRIEKHFTILMDRWMENSKGYLCPFAYTFMRTYLFGFHISPVIYLFKMHGGKELKIVCEIASHEKKALV